MDINTFRGITTALVLICFIAICVWAYSAKRKKRFDDAANLPFADENDNHGKDMNSKAEKKDHE